MKTRAETTVKTKSRSAAKQACMADTDDLPGNYGNYGNYDCSRERMIAEAAYFRAEQRGFMPGNEMSDWLQAEADVEGLLRGSP